MRGETLAEVINTVLKALGLFSVFFAGWLLASKDDLALFALALFLFVCGTFIIVSFRVYYEEETEESQ